MKKRTTTMRSGGARRTMTGRGKAFARSAFFIIHSSLFILLAACSKDHTPDPADGNAPVEITAATVGALAEAAATRVVDPDTGYDGIVKEAFVEGDRITIAMTKPDSETWLCSSIYEYTADGKWAPATGYETMWLPRNGQFRLLAGTPGKDILPASPAVSTYVDRLQLETTPGDGSGMLTYADGKWELKLRFSHTRSLLRFTVADGVQQPAMPPLEGIASVTAEMTAGGSTRTVGFEAWNAAANALIVPEDATLKSVTVVMESGQIYTATVGGATGKTLAEGKAYDIAVVAYGTVAEVTVSAPSDDWGWTMGGEAGAIVPEGYDRVIYDEASLRAFAAEVNAATSGEDARLKLKAIQMADITLTDGPNGEYTTDGGGNWVPIGRSREYKGVYNGNGYRVRGMRVAGSYIFAGFFGSVQDAVLAGIHLTGAYVENNLTSSDYAGTLAGYARASGDGKCVIALCSASGTVSGGSRSGGLVGCLVNVHLTRSRAAVEVSNKSWYAGGLVGHNTSGTIAGCSAAGNASADHSATGNNTYAGGLAGTSDGSSTIAFCYAAGNASAIGNAADKEQAGGLVGYNSSSIRYSYATGTASGANAGFGGSRIGSFVGSGSSSVEYGHALVAPNAQNTKFFGSVALTATNSTAVGAAALTVGATATEPDDGTGTAAMPYPFTVTACTVVYDKNATGPTRYKALDAWTSGGNAPAPRTFRSYDTDGNCIWTLAPGSNHPTINYGYNGE